MAAWNAAHQTNRREAGVRISVLISSINGVKIEISERQRTFVKRSHLARINPHFGCAIPVPSKLPRKQGVVPHGLFLRSHTHGEQTESREKQGNNKAWSHRSTTTSLHPFFSGGTGELRLPLTDGPLGGLSIGQQTEDYAISAGSRHRVSTKQPAPNMRS
jgi:hypothetical protein